jgi:ankyrin repeat protein
MSKKDLKKLLLLSCVCGLFGLSAGSIYFYCTKYIPIPVSIHSAAKNGDVEEIAYNLEYGISIDLESEKYFGGTPLHVAVFYKNIQSIKYLIQKGANINFQNKRTGATALHLSAMNDSPEIGLILLKNGAKPSLKTIKGLTPLDIANNKYSAKLRKFLRQRKLIFD